MARINLKVPENFSFTCTIPVRITDVNYGGHVGNDALLSIIHETRMQWLAGLGFTEMNFGGVGMIMADVAIEFKAELFYGDTVFASVVVAEISRIGFDIIYKLEKNVGAEKIIVAIAKTGMICYDYDRKKIVSVPSQVVTLLN